MPFPCSATTTCVEARGRAFRTRFHTPNNAHNTPRALRIKLGKFKIRDLEILMILGIRDFPCHSHALPRQRHACKEAECESRARGRVFRTCFRTSNHARVAPRPLRSKFGKIENFRFRIFRSEIWTVFALPLHLAVFGVCTLAVTSDFLRIYLKI